MSRSAHKSLVLLGSLWGLALAAPPAFVMADPSLPTLFLLAAVVCVVFGGIVGTLGVGRKVTKGSRAWPLSGFGIGARQGLIGGVVGGFLIWGPMAVTISGFNLGIPVELSVLTSPRVLLGSFFVSHSALTYALVGGLLLGSLVECAVREDKAGGVWREIAGEARGKEGTFVR